MFSLLKRLFPRPAHTDRDAGSVQSASKPNAGKDMAAECKILRDQGNAFLANGNLESAAACYAQATVIDSADVEAHINLAYVRGEQKCYGEAEHHLQRVVEIQPTNIDALFMSGTFARRQSNWADAKKYLKQTLALEPGFEVAYRCLLGLDHYDEAAALCDALLAVDANDVEALVNRGHAFKSACRYDDAVQSFATAAKLRPSHVDANFNESLCRLITGDLDRGWQLYEWRWMSDQLAAFKRSFKQPLWLGKESLAGKTILLHAEQGLGDTIQFCRYADMVAELGATVLMLVPKSLVSLLSNLRGANQIFTDGQELPAFDYHCPFLSLPLAFGTTLQTIPGEVPYLYASTELVSRIQQELGLNKTLKVGLCWKGGNAYPADSDRSPGIGPFQKLISRFDCSQVKFYTLLPDSREPFSRIGGEDLGYELDRNCAPFAETAALIMNLDLVISCDTSIGHIAGALGKKVWLVLPFSSDWRWIRGRDDSDWYPHTTLIRQAVPGDWDDVFDRVSMRLVSLVDEMKVAQHLLEQSPPSSAIKETDNGLWIRT